MGLFDKFRKKVQAAASEADTESLSAEEGSDEAIEAINQHQEIPNLSNSQPVSDTISTSNDDDDWEDEPEEYSVEEPERILPPIAPSRPDMDAATKALEPLSEKAETEEETVSSSEVETSSVDNDPWADVDHSEEE